jgi:hypothetical protein
MAFPRLRTNVFAVALGFTFALAAVTARAQGPGPIQSLSRELAALRARVARLEARVAKLNGHIVATDLVGTYTISDVQTNLFGGSPAMVQTGTIEGTLTMAADGTGSIDGTALGATLSEGTPWSLTPGGAAFSRTFTWTYDGAGILTLVLPEGTRPFHLAAGGRVMTWVSRDKSYSELAILTRLE